MELLRVSEAADVGVKEAVLCEDEVCGLHGSEGPAEVADIDGRMPAVVQLCEFLQPYSSVKCQYCQLPSDWAWPHGLIASLGW